MKIISFGKFKVISSDTIECGGGPDESSFINILLNDAIILKNIDKLPSPLREDEVYYAIPQYDENIVGVNRVKLSLHKNGDPIPFTDGTGVGEIQTVTNFTGWLSSKDVEHSRFQNVKNFRYQNYDTVQVYSSGELPSPLLDNQTYSIVSADEVSFRLSETTNGLPLSFTTVGSGIYFFTFSLVGFHPNNPNLLGATYTPLVTPVRNYHITDLRTRINNELIRRGKPTYTFTDTTLTAGVTKVTTTHINQLRTAAQQIAPYITLSVTDPVLVANVTKIKAVHLQEIDNYVAAREAQVKVTCTWNYAASTPATLPACISIDPVCAWGIGGGGGGGYGGTGGSGGSGGSGGCGGSGGGSGYSTGGCGGRGGAGRRGWFSLWPAGFQPPGGAGSGGGGGGGGAGTQPRQGYGGYGGGAGTAGSGGGGGGAGTAGTVGSGNIYSWPASPCILPVGSQNLYINIGAGGGAGGGGGNTYVCCTSGAILLTAAGGGAGSTESTGSAGAAGVNGANQTAVPPYPGEVAGGYNGTIGGDGGFAGFSTGTNPTCAWGGDGGTGGSDAGGGWLAGGGGGGGGSGYNYSYNQYGKWYTRCAWGGAGGGGKGGGGGGGAAGVLSADGGIVTGGGGGAPRSGGYYGDAGVGGTTFQCNSWPPDKDATGYGGAGGLGYNPFGGHGGYGGCVSQLNGNTCIGLSGGCSGGASPEFPSTGAGGDAGGAGGARTGQSGGGDGAPATGGNCGWFGYGCSGGGGAGGAGGYGGYGGAGGGGGAGASAPPGGPGGCGGCGSWSYACRIGGNQTFYAYTYGAYGSSCTYYYGHAGGGGEAGEGGAEGSGGSAGGSGSSGYVRLTFSVWV